MAGLCQEEANNLYALPLVCFLFVSKKDTVSDGHTYPGDKRCAAWLPKEQPG